MCEVRRCEVLPVLWQQLDEAEFGRPQWLFGWATWAFADERRMVATYARGAARWTLATIDIGSGNDHRRADGPGAARMAHGDAHARGLRCRADPTTPATVARTNLVDRRHEMLRSSSTLSLERQHISIPEAIEFPTEGGLTAHAFYYPPSNADVHRAPLRPSAAHRHQPRRADDADHEAVLDLQVQFWTSRGFAVVDVNYGGSSGYGRAYRERLELGVGHRGRGRQHQRGEVSGRAGEGRSRSADHPRRQRGRLHDARGARRFIPRCSGAGASYYGVSDVEALAQDTHKFESRYLDTTDRPVSGDARGSLRERSPIHFIDRLSCALILFQGLEDKVVPPDQSADDGRRGAREGAASRVLAFEGEQHGFRRAETIIRCLEAELSFYGAVFRFTPAGALTPLTIENLA